MSLQDSIPFAVCYICTGINVCVGPFYNLYLYIYLYVYVYFATQAEHNTMQIQIRNKNYSKNNKIEKETDSTGQTNRQDERVGLQIQV